jgi:hypothetical protein
MRTKIFNGIAWVLFGKKCISIINCETSHCMSVSKLEYTNKFYVSSIRHKMSKAAIINITKCGFRGPLILRITWSADPKFWMWAFFWRKDSQFWLQLAIYENMCLLYSARLLKYANKCTQINKYLGMGQEFSFLFEIRRSMSYTHLCVW